MAASAMAAIVIINMVIFSSCMGLLGEDQTANVYWTCSTKADAWIARS